MFALYKRSFLSALLVVALLGSFFAFPAPNSYAQTSLCGAMDVVFVIDDTGSMGGAIRSVSTEVNDLVTQINTASGGDYQLGLVTFKDDVTVRNDLAVDNTAAVVSNITALSASGGSGLPEASDEALNTVINGIDSADRPAGKQTGDFNGVFRGSAIKIVVLITDALPGGFDDSFTAGVDDTNAHARATEARDKGILISAIYVPTSLNTATAQGAINSVDGSTIEAIMRDYANTSGGLYLMTSSSGIGTSNAISDVLKRCGGGTPTPAPPPAVPEPMTMVLFGSGAAALGAYIRKRKKDMETLD